MKNNEKHQSYKTAMTLLKNAVENSDLHMNIAAITIAESIISDRCQSYLFYKEKVFMETNERNNKYVSTKQMLDKCCKHFSSLTMVINSKNGIIYTSEELFEDCLKWLKMRNKIIHGFAKSKPGLGTLSVSEFHELALKLTRDGLRLAKLVMKWHEQELQFSKKQNSTSLEIM